MFFYFFLEILELAKKIIKMIIILFLQLWNFKRILTILNGNNKYKQFKEKWHNWFLIWLLISILHKIKYDYKSYKQILFKFDTLQRNIDSQLLKVKSHSILNLVLVVTNIWRFSSYSFMNVSISRHWVNYSINFWKFTGIK